MRGLIHTYSNRVHFVCLSSPFYGEDFYCEIPRSFRHLSFYIFDRDVFRRDSIIGRYLNGRYLHGCSLALTNRISSWWKWQASPKHLLPLGPGGD